MKTLLIIISGFVAVPCSSQIKWVNVDSAYAPLPGGIHVYRSDTRVDGKPNLAYYVSADLRNIHLRFTTDTTLLRRITPGQYFQKNDKPVVIVNGTFFAPDNRNLNVVIKNEKIVSFSPRRNRKSAADSTILLPVYSSAIGINKKREADVAWLMTDSSWDHVMAGQQPGPPFREWKMETAIGGGPVLVQEGRVIITNNEELKFAGKAIHDKHPRTAMGYTAEGKLVILVVQGRQKGIAEGVSLIQLAEILTGLGCTEALNLDGGGSSCMLVNGKETIRPSDPAGQRPVPAVFMIHSGKRN